MSREIKLSRGKVALVDDADYEWLSQWKWWYHPEGYARGGKGGRYFLHRVIMGAPKGIQVDHIDGNGLNCQKNNLRLATNKQNAYNQRKYHYPKSTSQYKGVSLIVASGKWRACVMLNGKDINAGHYATEIEAARARDKKAKELHGEFASLNFPDET